MGDQSSGKSSVLEALSGVPFPRGSGLVTRCPTRLIMRKVRNLECVFTCTFCTPLGVALSQSMAFSLLHTLRVGGARRALGGSCVHHQEQLPADQGQVTCGAHGRDREAY